MAIYVTPLSDPDGDDWSRPTSILMADDERELHRAARRLGVDPKLFHASPPAIVPHYQLTAGKRAAALDAKIALDGEVFVGELHNCRLMWRLITTKRFLTWRKKHGTNQR